MHTVNHRFDHFGEDLARKLRCDWTALGLRIGDCLHWLLALGVTRTPEIDAEILWDDGEPEDKV